MQIWMALLLLSLWCWWFSTLRSLCCYCVWCSTVCLTIRLICFDFLDVDIANIVIVSELIRTTVFPPPNFSHWQNYWVFHNYYKLIRHQNISPHYHVRAQHVYNNKVNQLNDISILFLELVNKLIDQRMWTIFITVTIVICPITFCVPFWTNWFGYSNWMVSVLLNSVDITIQVKSDLKSKFCCLSI